MREAHNPYCGGDWDLFLFYLFEREREKTQVGGEGEADSPLSRVPDVGLDPRTPGS